MDGGELGHDRDIDRHHLDRPKTADEYSMTQPTITIALDIDETITAHPGFFAFISQALVQAGHRVSDTFPPRLIIHEA